MKISLKKKVVTGMVIIISILVVGFVSIFVLFAANSKGVIEGFYNSDGSVIDGSIVEKAFVNINGVEQGMIIRGEDINNPVILFLHGGPGMPEYFLKEIYPAGIEKYYTVCWWEQRGAGLSFDKSLNADEITNETMISDIKEVSNYLRNKFKKDKIYLLAHSGASFYGIQAASEFPELFHAYIGMAQIVNTRESEILAYEYMYGIYDEKNDKSKTGKFEKYNVYGNDDEFYSYMTSMLRDDSMHQLGIGTTRQINSIMKGRFLPVMRSNAYTMNEKINIWRGKAFIRNNTDLLKKITKADVSKMITSLHLPAYFMSGKYDYTVSYEITKEYVNSLQSGQKGFYTFENSAHSPLWEEPEKFIQIMNVDVLNGSNILAD